MLPDASTPNAQDYRYGSFWVLTFLCLTLLLIWFGAMQLEYEAQRRQECERLSDQMAWNPDTDTCVVKPLPGLKY
jgi:hypothetical protein